MAQSLVIGAGSSRPVSLSEAGSTVYVSGADVSYGTGTITAGSSASLYGTQTFSVDATSSSSASLTIVALQVSSQSSVWTSGASYSVGQLVSNAGQVYVTTTAHTAGSSFDASKFQVQAVIEGAVAQVGLGVELTQTSSYSSGFTAASFPACVQAADGSLIEIHRRGYNHQTLYGNADPNQAAMGKLMVKKARSIRLLAGATATEIVTPFSATRDLRDVGLYREPGTRRIWATFFLKDPGTPDGNTWAGIWAIYTDDEFATWSAPIQIKGTNWFSGSRLRKLSDGKYYLPVYYRGGSGGTDFAVLLRFDTLNPAGIATPTVMPPVRYKATTISNGGGYTAGATSINVADGTKIAAGDYLYFPSTGEYALAGTPSGNTIPLAARGTQSALGGVAAAAIADGAEVRAVRATASAESDIVETDRNTLVSVVRSGGTSSAPTVSVSTDLAQTWTDWSQISASPYGTLDGWPTLVRGEAGQPILAVRSDYGLRLLRPANSTVFSDGSQWGYVFDATSANVQGALIPPYAGTQGVGKWQPIKLPGTTTWIGPAYRQEGSDQTVQDIVWVQWDERTMYSKQVYLTTEQQPTGPATTAAALPTAAKVQFWSPGAFYDVTCSAEHKQPTAAASVVNRTIQVAHTGPAAQDIDKFSNGLASNLVAADETAVTLTGMARTESSTILIANDSARYALNMRGLAFFPKGFHTLEVYVSNASVGGSGNYVSSLPFWRNVKLSAAIRA